MHPPLRGCVRGARIFIRRGWQPRALGGERTAYFLQESLTIFKSVTISMWPPPPCPPPWPSPDCAASLVAFGEELLDGAWPPCAWCCGTWPVTVTVCPTCSLRSTDLLRKW